ncbi:alpha/beta fold hydrolase [Nocardia sp. NPDC052001]|uniref:esterase/lipase family protein n=1 Tax=Nocardia sp. NPDC052001 TaxID=3154853 RepID=UPI00341A7A6B
MRAIAGLSATLAVASMVCAPGAVADPAPPGATPLASLDACPPGNRGEPPVLLIHGTNASVEKSLGPTRQALLDDGRCVYGLDYDSMQPVSTSVDYFAAAVDRIIELNPRTTVDVVGKSQGALIARAVSLKFTDPERNSIRRVVSISGPQHGVTEVVGGIDITALGAGTPVFNLLRRDALRDMLIGSPYLSALNAGPLTAPNVRYTMIATETDRLVTPYTSGFIDAANVTNVLLQDGCPQDRAGHLAESTDPRTIDLTLHALDPTRHPEVRCLPNTDER